MSQLSSSAAAICIHRIGSNEVLSCLEEGRRSVLCGWVLDMCDVLLGRGFVDGGPACRTPDLSGRLVEGWLLVRVGLEMGTESFCQEAHRLHSCRKLGSLGFARATDLVSAFRRPLGSDLEPNFVSIL